MRHLNFSHLKEINEKYMFLNNIKYFIETGSYEGGSINNLKDYFFEYHSIELNKINYDICKNKFAYCSKIKLYNDDSVNILSSLIKKINSNTLYFLDAHHNNNDNIESSKNLIDVPILSELKIIIENDYNESIIIINNYRLFGLKECEETGFTNWENITIKNIINTLNLKNIKDHFLLPSASRVKKNDKYIIILKNRTNDIQSNYVLVENNSNSSNEENEIEENDIEENDIEENDIEENDIEENDIEENDIEENDIEENDIELIFYKNGYMYNNEFKSSSISQNRDYLGQLLKMRNQLSLNIIDKREETYNVS